MMTALIRILLLFIILSIPAGAARAQAMPEMVMASLKSEVAAVEPGKPFRLGVLLEPKEGWHTYWENPGDAGLATELSWTLPKGFSASGIDWPPPMRLAEDMLAVYGYEGRVFLPVTVTPAPALNPAAKYAFHVSASWLACKDICIPESINLTLSLPVGEATPSQFSALFTAHDAQKPVTMPEPLAYKADDKRLVLSVPLAALNLTAQNIDGASFFPRQSNVVRHAATQRVDIENGTLLLAIERVESPLPDTLSGLLKINDRYFDVSLEKTTMESVAPEPDAVPIPEWLKEEAKSPASRPTQDIWLPAVLFFALLGGVILNLMPCVLPVLSLKCLAVVEQANGNRREVQRHGASYTLGILVSFAAFAFLIFGLKNAGEAVGWGFQMQSPAFVGFLIYLLFLIGLSLSGFFHLPVLFGNVGGGGTTLKGSFATGVLAAVVATPCTAPFMATAVGAALVLPQWQAFLIFQALGLGLALPFLLISVAPRLLKFLPKPGRWMETFKQLLAFPMYASVIWLLWVLAQQTSADGLVVALLGMLSIVIALWMKALFKDGSMAYRLFVLAAIVGVLALSLPALGRMEKARMAIPADCAVQDVNTVPYSPQALANLRRRGEPVLVDATAAWCLTCQVNARVAIHTERTLQTLKDRGITLMVADWTRRNPDVTAFLAGFGYSGVPLVVYYPPAGGEPRILPQLLTEDIVINAITNN